MISLKTLKKHVPLEVLPLGVAIIGVTSYAAYRLYSMLRKPDVILRKSDAEKLSWKGEK
jgi:NADH-ubiquinone reductase complex 1 MLRQ subunit